LPQKSLSNYVLRFCKVRQVRVVCWSDRDSTVEHQIVRFQIVFVLKKDKGNRFGLKILISLISKEKRRSGLQFVVQSYVHLSPLFYHSGLDTSLYCNYQEDLDKLLVLASPIHPAERSTKLYLAVITPLHHLIQHYRWLGTLFFPFSYNLAASNKSTWHFLENIFSFRLRRNEVEGDWSERWARYVPVQTRPDLPIRH